MSLTEVILPDENAALNIGASLAREIPSGLVFLSGDLGVGKTTIVRGWLRALGHPGTVKSPTYTLIEPYDLNGTSILHIDLYRIEDPAELEFIGLHELLEQTQLQLVEWPEKGSVRLPKPTVTISISCQDDGTRVAQICKTDV